MRATTGNERGIEWRSPAGAAQAAQVRRRAFYLDSQGQAILAWLHAPEGAARSGHGVVVCAPIGYEQVHSHRSLRHLADALARAGFPVLRFDYAGTGDSAGIEEQEGQLQTWLGNIRDSIAWMRREIGCEKIHLAGLRLGAALAAQVASAEPVDSLLLWAPVVQGRTYVREIRALSLTAASASPAPSSTNGNLEAAGFILTRQTAEDLGGIDLLKRDPPCSRILILGRDDLQEDRRLFERWRQAGVRMDQELLRGYAEMMAEPHFTQVPHDAIRATVDWLSAQCDDWADAPVHQDAILELERRPRFVDVASGETPPRVREQIYWVGSPQGLFGVLTSPDADEPNDRPFVVMINAGSVHRIGPNRLYVMLARQLAARGFRSLRVDLGGLGDSAASNPAQENYPYTPTAFQDIERILAALRADLGARRVVLMGLCSGAYFAFQAAVRMADPLLVESLLLNPLTFYWKEGMSLEAAPARQHKILHYYREAALQPGNWLRFFSGATRTSPLSALRVLSLHWKMKFQPAEAAPASASDATLPAKPTKEDLARDLERAVSDRRRLAFFFSASDPGYAILKFYARGKVRKLKRAGKIRLFFIENADHTFTGRAPRQAVVSAITEYLSQRYPLGASPLES